jgi:hypothetical protein
MKMERATKLCIENFHFKKDKVFKAVREAHSQKEAIEFTLRFSA